MMIRWRQSEVEMMLMGEVRSPRTHYNQSYEHPDPNYPQDKDPDA